MTEDGYRNETRKTEMVIWSHLSDIQEGRMAASEERKVVNFIKMVVHLLAQGKQEVTVGEMDDLYDKYVIKDKIRG